MTQNPQLLQARVFPGVSDDALVHAAVAQNCAERGSADAAGLSTNSRRRAKSDVPIIASWSVSSSDSATSSALLAMKAPIWDAERASAGG